jgi:pantetheine-phosphate adenylyltransferase
MPRAVYPGSFDPVHNGHLDLMARASKLFDRLLVGVFEAPPKKALFTTEQRVGLIEEAVVDLKNVEVASFGGLVPDLARQFGARFIVRGLRAGIDFETEFEMTLMWRKIDPEIDVVCLMSSLQYLYVHSSRIKEVAQLGGDIDDLIPKNVATELRARVQSGLHTEKA